MNPADFPYRAIGSAETAAALHQRTEGIKQLLAEVTLAVVTIGQSVAWAGGALRPELLAAWLLGELGWTPRVADAFIDAAVNFESGRAVCTPAAALDFASNLAAHSIAARELTKAHKLLQAYRAIVKGDATVARPRSCRPRASIKSTSPRFRGRVYRATLRRDELNTDEFSD